MKVKQYIPIVTILVVLGVLVGAQEFLARERDSDSTQQYQAQVGDSGNTLENFTRFELEIELQKGHEVSMHYITNSQVSNPIVVVKPRDRGNQGESTGDHALEEIRELLAAVPPLTDQKPLPLLEAILDHLEIDQEEITELELEYEFPDGTIRKIELDIDDHD